MAHRRTRKHMHGHDSPLNSIKPSPRVTLAAQLYATGAAPTKKAASEMAGLHPNYLTMLRTNPAVQAIIEGTQTRVSDEAVGASALVQALAAEAIGTIAHIMRASGSEALKLKAAQDLADRAPETSKVQKHAITSFSLGAQDAKDLARALVEAASVKREFAHVAEGNFVQIQQSIQAGPSELPLSVTPSPYDDGIQGPEALGEEASDNAPELQGSSASQTEQA